MMIDNNLTPVSDIDAQQPVETAQASAATTSDIPTHNDVPVGEPTPAPVAEVGPEPAPVQEPVLEAPKVEASAVTASPETAEKPPEPAKLIEAPKVPIVVAKSSTADSDLFESYMSALDGGDGQESDVAYKKLSRGERIEATIIQVDKDRVFVDLGTKSEGIVPLAELSDENLETAQGHFNVGDKITVLVIRPESGDSNPIVSKRRADFEEVWDRVEEAFKTQETLNATVIDRVKGGLAVDVGVRGFVPATHVGSGKLRNIEKYVGQTLHLKVIEIDRERKKVVLSNRQAEEELRASAKEDIFSNVQVGATLEGTVRRLTDYGAFVDLGGVDGLLHISEMSWMRINHPKEIFKEGQKIKVMVLRLDPEAGKISLGHRQVLPDPWNLIRQNYTVGQKLTVQVSRLVQSGAFVKLPEGAEAFMPISEMSVRRIRRPEEVIEEGQEVEVQIIDLRTEERRMVLSIKALGGADRDTGRGGGPETPGSYEDEYRGGKPGIKGAKKGAKKGRGGRDDFDDFEDVAGRRGFATGGATIGERLGALKGFLGRDDDEDEADKVEGGEATVDENEHA